MNPLAFILLFFASTNVNLVDEVYRIPANEWRWVEVSLRQRPALVSANFRVESGNPDVRLILMRGEDRERLRDGMPHGWIVETPAGRSGHLDWMVRRPDDYAVVVDNLGGATVVNLRVTLDFGARQLPEATSLSSGRRLAVILISFGVFFGIVLFSARRLIRAIRP